MYTSRDKEIFRIRETFGLDTNVRFFLLGNRDLNFYHYGILNPKRHWTHHEFDKALEAISDLPDTARDVELERLLAYRCFERRGFGGDVRYWEDLIGRLWTPSDFAAGLRSLDKNRQQSVVQDFATVMHCVPQSFQTGVMSMVSNALQKKGSIIRRLLIGAGAPWDSTESTLAVLRPLEYFFGIGSPGARDATIHILYNKYSFMLGTILNFSKAEIQPPALEEIERVLENLAVKELTGFMHAVSSDHDFLASAAENLHRSLPIHTTAFWKDLAGTPKLLRIMGLPWEPRTAVPKSVMASSSVLRRLPSSSTEWLAKQIEKRDSQSPCFRSSLGTVYCEELPPWGFTARKSGNPLDPHICISVVNEVRDEALQIIVPLIGCDHLQNDEVAQNVLMFLNTTRILSSEVSSAGRFGGGEISLPDEQWVYNADSKRQIIRMIKSLRNSWAGEESADPRPRLMFCGRPGTGKSELARWFAREIVGDPNPTIVSAADIKRKFHGETEKEIKKLIKEVCDQTCKVLIVDEVEMFAREPQGDVHDNVAAAFKAELDKIESTVRADPSLKLLVIATTNYFETLDLGIKSRFDAVQLSWGPEEFGELFKRTRRLKWTDGAQDELLQAARRYDFDPRWALRAIKNAEKIADERRATLFEDPVVEEEYLVSASNAMPDWFKQELAQSDETKGVLPSAEIKSCKKILGEILDTALKEGWVDNSKIGDHQFLDKNKIALLCKLFPSFSAEFNRIKKANADQKNMERIVYIE